MKAKSVGLSPDLFIKRLQGGIIPTVVSLVGEEVFFRDLVRQTLLERIFADTPEDSREIAVFEEKTDLRQLETIVNTYPFFSRRTVVVVTDKELLNPKGAAEVKTGKGKGKANKGAAVSRQEVLQRILADVPEFCTVILQAEKMDGRQKLTRFLQQETAFVDCSPADGRSLPLWLRQQAEQRGGRFEAAAIDRIQEYLATVDNPPLQLLSGEIDKIALYAGERKDWTVEDVDLLFSALPEAGTFALNNALASKNLVQALQLLAEEQRKNAYLPLLVAKLTANLRNLLAVREGERLGHSPAQMAEELHKSPFVITMWKRDGARFPEGRLRSCIQAMDRLAEEVSLGGRQYDRLEEIFAVLCS